MRAGLLKYFITFLQLKSEKDWSGSALKTWEEVLDTRCAKRKLATQGIGVTAMEEFISGTVVVQVRCNDLINDGQRFKFGRYQYRITLIDEQDDRTLLITGTRLNDNEI
jgi:phage head-tail adaptor, putative, SPP1 family